MTVTTTSLTKAAGVAAATAGAMFIGVQIGHPQLNLTTITSTDVLIRDCFKVLMAPLAVAGFTGMYLSQVRRNGVLGLVGYLVLSAGFLLIMCTTFFAAFVAPTLAGSNPGFVKDVIALSTSQGSVTGDVGALAPLWQVQSLCFLVGGVLFGIALFRAGVLARWATVLLAIGGLVSIALSFTSDAFYRFLAYPTAIALIGLGVSLWMSQRTVSPVETSSVETSSVETGSVETGASPAPVPSHDDAPAVR